MNNHPPIIRSRIIADITLFFVALYAPWWFFAVAVFLGILFFKNFYEAFFLGLLFDMLYGANIASLHGFRFVFSTSFLAILFIAEFIKTKVRV